MTHFGLVASLPRAVFAEFQLVNFLHRDAISKRNGPCFQKVLFSKEEIGPMKAIVGTTVVIAAAFSLSLAFSNPAHARGGPGGGVGAAHGAAFGPSASPHGFTQGRKVGWHGATTPPGWRKGTKLGWQGHSVPPGWRGQ
jgi:hypothetical protein